MIEADLIVIGGGAAGFFAAARAAACFPSKKIFIFEKSGKVLSKVKISGGGRCNVTHNCFDLKELITRYPRGGKELLGPFHKFGPKETIQWFHSRGVPLKVEEDGRIFPVSDNSETIINCLLSEIKSLGVELITFLNIEAFERKEEGFYFNTNHGEYLAKSVVLATGSSPFGHEMARKLGHTVTPLVPSLFTFNTPTSPLLDLSGIAVDDVSLSIEGVKLKTSGTILLTHFGFSGPAALRLSSIAAIELNQMNYHGSLVIDWTNGFSKIELLEKIKSLKQTKEVITLSHFRDFPKNLSKQLLEGLNIPIDKKFAQMTNDEINRLIDCLTASKYKIEGKTTNKAEFVTAGGVLLSEVSFKTMESKIVPNLYFAGEILNIDGITGGFNFQNAWTTGFIAGSNSILTV